MFTIVSETYVYNNHPLQYLEILQYDWPIRYNSSLSLKVTRFISISGRISDNCCNMWGWSIFEARILYSFKHGIDPFQCNFKSWMSQFTIARFRSNWLRICFKILRLLLQKRSLFCQFFFCNKNNNIINAFYWTAYIFCREKKIEEICLFYP